MRPLARETIEMMRKKYPAGTRVELILMDDPQAPPVGTKGTVIGVDAVGTVHVNWDNGCGLGLAYGADEFRVIKQIGG